MVFMIFYNGNKIVIEGNQKKNLELSINDIKIFVTSVYCL